MNGLIEVICFMFMVLIGCFMINCDSGPYAKHVYAYISTGECPAELEEEE